MLLFETYNGVSERQRSGFAGTKQFVLASLAVCSGQAAGGPAEPRNVANGANILRMPRMTLCSQSLRVLDSFCECRKGTRHFILQPQLVFFDSVKNSNESEQPKESQKNKKLN
jgi:hypothetical protein